MSQQLSKELVEGLRRMAVQKALATQQKECDALNQKYKKDIGEVERLSQLFIKVQSQLSAKQSEVSRKLTPIAQAAGLMHGQGYDSRGHYSAGIKFIPGSVHGQSKEVEEMIFKLRLAVETGDDVKQAIEKIFGFKAETF